MYRLDKGLELYRSGFAERIIAFGGIEMGESELVYSKNMNS